MWCFASRLPSAQRWLCFDRRGSHPSIGVVCLCGSIKQAEVLWEERHHRNVRSSSLLPLNTQSKKMNIFPHIIKSLFCGGVLTTHLIKNITLISLLDNRRSKRVTKGQRGRASSVYCFPVRRERRRKGKRRWESCPLSAIALHLLKRKMPGICGEKTHMSIFIVRYRKADYICLLHFPRAIKETKFPLCSHLSCVFPVDAGIWEERSCGFPGWYLPSPVCSETGAGGIGLFLPASASFVSGPTKTPQSIRS